MSHEGQKRVRAEQRERELRYSREREDRENHESRGCQRSRGCCCCCTRRLCRDLAPPWQPVVPRQHSVVARNFLFRLPNRPDFPPRAACTTAGSRASALAAAFV